MSSEEDLKSFKISDQVPNKVDRPKGKSTESAAEAQASAGFPRIEALIEQDLADFAGMQERYAALQEMAKSGGSAKEKGAAKKAALAYSHALGIISYLLETKKSLNQG